MRQKLILLIGIALLTLSCSEEKVQPVPSFRKHVETKSGLVLYTPNHFAVTPTHATGLAAGFLLEDRANETLAGIVESTSRQANVSGTAAAPFTSPAFVKSALVSYLDDIKKKITIILPGSNPDEGAGDWSITTLSLETTTDRRGQSAAYGHFVLQYAPVYQLRSYQMFHYLAAVILGINWTNYPANTDDYFAAGNSSIQFTVALATYHEEDFFGGQDNSRKVAVSISAFPGNKSAPVIEDSLDDLLAFKTFGTLKDTLVEKVSDFVVEEGAPPLDLIFALDRGGGMEEEAPRFRSELTEMISELFDAGEYDLRVAFVTNDGPEFVRLKDNQPFLTSTSNDPGVLTRSVLDTIWSTANGEYIVENQLLYNAVYAATTSTNPGFRRFDAPLVLFYVADREDVSPRLDDSALAGLDFAPYYAAELKDYDYTMFVAPKSKCSNTDVSAGSIATRLDTISTRLGHFFQDMCKNDHVTYKQDLAEWAEAAVSTFTFGSPQPFAFTLSVTLNNTALPQSYTDGYVYDPLGDRLQFAPSVEPKGGDTVRAKYFVLETPLPPARK